MTLIEDLEEIKQRLMALKEKISTLDQDIQEQCMAGIDESIKNIFNAAALVEKHYQDERMSEEMKVDLVSRFKKETVFQKFNDSDIGKFAQAMVDQTGLKILTKPDLLKVISGSLKRSNVEDLVPIVYSKSEIIRMGKRVLDTNETNETILYNKGFDTYKKLAETPTSFGELVADAEVEILSSFDKWSKFVYDYYGVTKEGK